VSRVRLDSARADRLADALRAEDVQPSEGMLRAGLRFLADEIRRAQKRSGPGARKAVRP
jgi:hypothetical protein